jgi:hypothetical protein
MMAGGDATFDDLRRIGRNISSCIFEDNHLPDPVDLLQSRGMISKDYGLDLEGSYFLPKRIVVIPDILLGQFNNGMKFRVLIFLNGF